MFNLNHFKMKNLMVMFMMSLFVTQLLATQVVNATKFETEKTELSVMVKPIVFENVQLNSVDVKPIVFENVLNPEPTIETQYVQVESVNIEANIPNDRKPKQGKGYNYSKHYKKSKRKTFFSRLFNTDNCNHYRKHGYV
jgi:hypothetical protein